MPNTATRYARTAVGTASTTLTTIPAGTALVTEIILSNTTAADITVTLSLAGVALMTNVAVPGNGNIVMGLKQVMSATETITAIASAAGVNAFVSGVQVT